MSDTSKDSDKLDLENIKTNLKEYARENLETAYVGKVHYFSTIDSTNAWLLAHGNEGDFCVSDTQTAGRGRRDNEWISPNSGNIYLSYCCRIENSVPRRSLMGLLVGIASAEALEKCGLSGHGVKWPNDILWQQKKLGGILIQTRDNSETFIIGIGLNLHLPEQSHTEITQSAVSLNDAMLGNSPSRDVVLLSLMKSLLSYIELFPKLPYPLFLKSWQRWDLLQGQDVTLERQNDEISGIVKGIDEYGRLAIQIDTETHYFSVGDIRLKKNRS